MRKIGKADVEFYNSDLVLIVAKSISDKNYDELSHRSRQRVLDKAVSAIQSLLNSEDARTKLKMLLKE